MDHIPLLFQCSAAQEFKILNIGFFFLETSSDIKWMIFFWMPGVASINFQCYIQNGSNKKDCVTCWYLWIELNCFHIHKLLPRRLFSLPWAPLLQIELFLQFQVFHSHCSPNSSLFDLKSKIFWLNILFNLKVCSCTKIF